MSATSLEQLSQHQLVHPTRELQERFLGIPLSLVLNDAVEELDTLVEQKAKLEIFRERSMFHSERISKYLQYLIQKSERGERSIRAGVGKQKATSLYGNRYNVSIRHTAYVASEGENISYRGTVEIRGENLHPVTSELYVDVPDVHGRYTRRFEFTNKVYGNTGEPFFTIKRTISSHLGDDPDNPGTIKTVSVDWKGEKVDYTTPHASASVSDQNDPFPLEQAQLPLLS